MVKKPYELDSLLVEANASLKECLKRLEHAKERKAEYPGEDVFGDYISLFVVDDDGRFLGGIGDGQIRWKLIETLEAGGDVATLTARDFVQRDRPLSGDPEAMLRTDRPGVTGYVRRGGRPLPAVLQAQR